MILIDAHPKHDWLVRAVERRLREELAKLRVEINEDKEPECRFEDEGRELYASWDLSFVASAFVIREGGDPTVTPKLKKRTALFERLREVFRSHRQPARLGK